jgi:hypothetical protein
MTDQTFARRWVRAFGEHDDAALDELYDEDVVFYGTLAWGVRGRRAVKDFADMFHRGNPGMRVILHDEIYSADGTRCVVRFALHFHNTGPFFGKSPTGKRGVQIETHTFTLRGGRAIEQIQAGNNFPLAELEIVDLELEWPRVTPDPHPAIVEGRSAGEEVATPVIEAMGD